MACGRAKYGAYSGGVWRRMVWYGGRVRMVECTRGRIPFSMNVVAATTLSALVHREGM